MPEATAPKPAVGRIVHYVSHGTPLKADGTQEYSSTCRAAIITEAYYEDFNCTIVTDDVASLAVLNPTGIFFADAASHDEDNHRGGTWHWPERAWYAGKYCGEGRREDVSTKAFAALRAVLDIHKPEPTKFTTGVFLTCKHCDTGDPYCTVSQDWPCPTVQAVTKALGGEQ